MTDEKLDEGSTFNYEPDFFEIKSKGPLTVQLPRPKERKIVDYAIVTDMHSDSLEKSVNMHLSTGYQPYGNVFERKVGRDSFIYQAMVKYEEKEDER